MEDYLEVIYELLKEKGYVKSKDISRILNVKASTVTIMLKTLAEKKLINYEKYGGITLTEEGVKKAEEISRKHKIIIDFLLLLGIDEKQANLEAEGIEHIISDETLRKIEKLYNLIKEDEEIERKIKEKLYNV
jgi:Mn-dependent DtxR family transcriptional regulator